MTTPGKLIVLDAINNAGKTTLAKALRRSFEAASLPVAGLVEPAPVSAARRELQRGATHGPEAWAVLMLAGMLEQDRVVRELLEAGTHVLMDRREMSTRAYQVSREPRLGPLVTVISAELAPVDLWLWLDVPPGIAASRAVAATGKDQAAFSELETEFRAHRAYANVFAATHPDRCSRLDATRDAATIHFTALCDIAFKLGINIPAPQEIGAAPSDAAEPGAT